MVNLYEKKMCQLIKMPQEWFRYQGEFVKKDIIYSLVITPKLETFYVVNYLQSVHDLSVIMDVAGVEKLNNW